MVFQIVPITQVRVLGYGMKDVGMYMYVAKHVLADICKPEFQRVEMQSIMYKHVLRGAKTLQKRMGGISGVLF